MNKILITVVGFVILVGAALLVAPHFINWNDYKADITEQVSRAITYGGESLLPRERGQIDHLDLEPVVLQIRA